MTLGFDQYYSSCDECGVVNILDAQTSSYSMGREAKWCGCGNQVQTSSGEDTLL